MLPNNKQVIEGSGSSVLIRKMVNLKRKKKKSEERKVGS